MQKKLPRFIEIGFEKYFLGPKTVREFWEDDPCMFRSEEALPNKMTPEYTFHDRSPTCSNTFWTMILAYPEKARKGSNPKNRSVFYWKFAKIFSENKTKTKILLLTTILIFSRKNG